MFNHNKEKSKGRDPCTRWLPVAIGNLFHQEHLHAQVISYFDTGERKWISPRAILPHWLCVYVCVCVTSWSTRLFNLFPRTMNWSYYGQNAFKKSQPKRLHYFCLLSYLRFFLILEKKNPQLLFHSYMLCHTGFCWFFKLYFIGKMERF